MLLGQPGLLSRSERLLTLRAFSNLRLLRNQPLNLQLHKRKPSKGLLVEAQTCHLMRVCIVLSLVFGSQVKRKRGLVRLD